MSSHAQSKSEMGNWEAGMHPMRLATSKRCSSSTTTPISSLVKKINYEPGNCFKVKNRSRCCCCCKIEECHPQTERD